MAAVSKLVLLSMCANAPASPGSGRVGGSPAIKLGPPYEGTRTSPALVIGFGSTLDRATQLVAFGWNPEPDSPPANFCLWIERPPREVEFGACAAPLDEEDGAAIDMQTQTLARRPGRSTAVGGRVAPRVAVVRLYFHRPKGVKRRRVDALVAQVDGDLQRRLKQSAPFGFFYARVRGIVRFGAFKAQALDSSGNVIGTAGGGAP